ncbi:MAG: sugar ABC transporter permease [Sphaerochaetaceae bacterium]|nr:sugar ABC transporter permease [Sphaerochaetaceae bacterium]
MIRRKHPLSWHTPLSPYIFLLPTIIGLIVFRLIPIGASFYLSFTDWTLLGDPLFVGLENYREAFRDKAFITVILNTLEFSLIYIAGAMALGLIYALLINVQIKGIAAFRAVIYLPVVTSAVAVGIVWMWMLGPTYGLINRGIEAIGITPPYWFQDANLVLKSVSMVQVWKMAGYYMILFLAGLKQVPKDTLDAAIVDGATPFQSFFRITLPILSPTSFFVLTVAIIDSFKNFELIYSMTKGGPQNHSTTLVYSVYVNAFVHYRVGFAATVAYVLLMFVGALTIVNFIVKRRWARPWE